MRWLIDKQLDRLYYWALPPDKNYEQWTVFEAVKMFLVCFIIFCLTPSWIFDVFKRASRMLWHKITDGDMKKFHRAEAKRELGN